MSRGQVVEEEEEEGEVVVESLVKQGLLGKACHRPLCTAGQTFQVQHMGKIGYGHVLGGFSE